MTDQFKLDFTPANDRGFMRADFRDRNGDECSIQESSLATEECVWLGLNEGTHHHVAGDCLARMHLTRDQAREIGRALTRFAMHGTLTEPSLEEHPPLNEDIKTIIERYGDNLEAFYRDVYVLARQRIAELEARLAAMEKKLADEFVSAVTPLPMPKLEARLLEIRLGASKSLDDLLQANHQYALGFANLTVQLQGSLAAGVKLERELKDAQGRIVEIEAQLVEANERAESAELKLDMTLVLFQKAGKRAETAEGSE